MKILYYSVYRGKLIAIPAHNIEVSRALLKIGQDFLDKNQIDLFNLLCNTETHTQLIEIVFS
jgi:hypothetical protein